MFDFKITDIYKKNPIIFLSILLFISLASALFMPAMFTFYFGLPLLILFLLKQQLTWVGFWTTVAVIGVSVFLVIGFAIYWVFLFTPFIHSFPTFVVLVLTLLLMHLIPIKMHLIYRIIIFLLLSTLIGLNTKIIDFIKPKYFIEQKINHILMLKDSDIVKITGDTLEIPSSYSPFDFISFNSNEGSGGFWVYPKFESVNIVELLQQKEISYTQKNDSPNTLIINYSKNIDEYSAEIQLKSDSKHMSSLKIVDQLPYQSSINANELENFDLRLEYLLRHNIWNAVLFFSDIASKRDKNLINDFLNKSIKSTPKNTDWKSFTLDLDSSILSKSNKQECISEPINDDYYPFSQWVETHQYNNLQITPDANYIFENNNTFYTTQDHSNIKDILRIEPFAYSKDENIYIFFTFESSLETIRVLKFTKTGQFLNQLNIHLPKDLSLDGRDWHPISHIYFTNNKIKFRFYNLSEDDKCMFYELETKSLAD